MKHVIYKPLTLLNPVNADSEWTEVLMDIKTVARALFNGVASIRLLDSIFK
jgi:hypothetical protein